MHKAMLLRFALLLLCVTLTVGLILGAGYGESLLSSRETTESVQDTTEESTQSATVPVTTAPAGTTVPETEETTEAAVTLPALELYAKFAFVYIQTTGELIMVRGEADDSVYPASVTKLFSAYVALQYLNPDQKITAGAELGLVPWDSSKAGLSQGDVLTVRELVEGMLLPSGNDAATVLAVAAGRKIAGNSKLGYRKAIEHFIGEMNRRGEQYGLTGTHFETADGYHDADHYTTCRDLAAIGSIAMTNGTIRRAAMIQEKQITLKGGKVRTWKNTNLLLKEDSEYYNPFACGLKTGSTGAAGKCLLAAFDVDGTEFLIGVFGCKEEEQRFADVQTIFQAFVFG